MVAFTASKLLTLVANSSYVGTWDQPTNTNWSVVDSALGGVIDIPLNNSPVTLSAPQFQSSFIIFSSTLTADVLVTFPTSFTGSYFIWNNCTGIDSFAIVMWNGAGFYSCPPPGEIISVINNAFGVQYTSFERIGSLMAYGGSSLPRWSTGSNPNPYLECNGTAFSTASYPALAAVLGSGTLPTVPPLFAGGITLIRSG